MASLDPNQVLVLCALRDGARRATEIKRPAAAARNAAVKALEAGGLVEGRKEGRTVVLGLTGEGARVARGLEAPAPAPAPKAPAPGVVLAQILAGVEELRRAVARIEARLDGAQRSAAAPASAGVAPDALRRAILTALRELDARHRYGGLVPIPELRRALAPHGFPQAAVDATLEALERDFVIDLNVAQAPTQVPESAAGILRPGRGLLYYVARREVT